MIMNLLPARKEQRATFKENEGWLADWARGGRRTLSGKVVSPNSALTLSSYYAAIRNIAEDMAKMPIDIIQRSPGGGKRKKLRKHPAYRLLNVAPNPEMDPIAFRETLLHHAMGWGNGTAEIVHTRGGVPVELWPMDPSRVEIKHEKDNSGRQRLVYEIRNVPGDPDVRLPPEKVYHLHGLGFDGIRGYAFATIAREAIGLGIAEVEAGAALFGNAILPSGVLSVPGKLTLEAQTALREGWEEQYQGTERMHRLAILHAGATFTPISINPEDAQWIQARQFTIEEMARVARIPLSKLQSLVKANFNTLQMQNMEYHIDTLLGWMIRGEQQIRRKLIGIEVDDVYAKHNANAILRADIEMRYRAYAIGRQWGWLSPNNVREKEDEDGIGKKGDIYLVPGNMMDASKVNEPAPAKDVIPQPAAGEEDGRSLAARKLAIGLRVHEQLAEATSSADAIRKIVWSHAPALTEAFGRSVRKAENRLARAKRAPDTLESFRSEHIEETGSWILNVASACTDTAWGVLCNTRAPESSVRAVREWSQDSASRFVGLLVDSGAAVNVDATVTAELGHLTRFTCDLLCLDAEKAQEN